MAGPRGGPPGGRELASASDDRPVSRPRPRSSAELLGAPPGDLDGGGPRRSCTSTPQPGVGGGVPRSRTGAPPGPPGAAGAVATAALHEAEAIAERLGARPLLGDVESLARRARIELHPARGPDEPARPRPAGAHGLGARG